MSIVDDILAWASPTGPVDTLRSGFNMDAAGKLIAGMSHLQYGLQAQQAGEYRGQQLDINAGQAQAAAQRDAFNADRTGQLVNSRALAVAAASGGGASDPNVINLMARNASEAAYQRAVSLYEGSDKSRFLQSQAEAARYEGRNTAVNSALVGAGNLMGVRSTLLRGKAKEGSMLSRFGGDGPQITPNRTPTGWDD